MRYVFIVNPVAGKGKKQKSLVAEIEAYFEDKAEAFSIIQTTHKGHAKEIAKSEAETGDDLIIFSCGGDGTLFEVINGVYGYENTSVGVFPIGSGNDFIKSTGKKEDFLNISRQMEGEKSKIDLIQFGKLYSLNVACVGFDAYVADNMSKFKKIPLVKGQLTYILSIFYCLFKHISNRFKITFDDGEVAEGDYLLTAIANARFYGGGFQPAPNAIYNDGLLDVVEIKKVSRFKIVSLLKAYTKGEHIHMTDICRTMNAKKVKVESDKEMAVILDGETFHSENKSAEFEILPSAINMVLPKVNRI